MRSLQTIAFCLFIGCSLYAVQGAPVLEETDKQGFLFCKTCNVLVNQMVGYFEKGLSTEELVDIAVGICNTLHLYDKEFCRSIIGTNMPTFKYIYDNLDLVPGNICGIAFPSEHCKFADPEKVEWNIKPSPNPKPVVIEPPQPPAGSPTMKVLHLADVHWDPDYQEGSNSNCDQPLCCRATSGSLKSPTDAAGYWGDYRNCDIPWRTVENTLAHMSKQHPDAAYIIWTGDLVPHDVWIKNKTENLYELGRLTTLFKKYFPGIPVYPTLGNHESRPVNVFAPPEITDEEFSTSWLYKEAVKQWANWLPEETDSTILYGGYYTTLVKPGFRMVSMNMNYCYTLNWWSLSNSKDPASGLLWLNGVLEKAEMDGEKVHIMSHIPPGNSDCMAIFSREYNKIINRFESTVTGQFFGHTHRDDFKVFYDTEDPSRATNVAFIGPSVTTFDFLNPGYKVYIIDGERSNSTFGVLDHSTWFMNVTAANSDVSTPGSQQEPIWQILYEARADYGLKSLRPKELDNLFNRMISDNALSQLYYRNNHKASDYWIAKGCDRSCRTDLLCYVVTTNYADQSHCTHIKDKMNTQHLEF